MKDKIVISATGDSLFTADFPKEYDAEIKKINSIMQDCDVKITNLETNVMEFGPFASAFSGGTWINVRPDDFCNVEKFGFNYYGTANNHTLDYSYHGMESTLKVLDERGYAHSGSGESLDKASAPAVIEFGGKKVAVIAVTTTLNMAAKAGEATPVITARPGVNYVGFDAFYPIEEEQVKELKKIAETTFVNTYHNLMVSSGFELADKDGLFVFGNLKFCYDKSKKTTECNPKDKARFLSTVKKAKEENDLVIVLIHCHEIGKTSHEEVPEFYHELATETIDAGASAIIGGGTHQLRPLQIYKGAPIFYSLGDFIYQGMRVKHLPADFLTKYGCKNTASALEGLMARSQGGKIGLQSQKCNFLTVLPKMEFVDGKMVSLKMTPISLGFEKDGDMNGLPCIANEEEGKEIFDILHRLSAPYGTQLKIENNVIELVK